MKSQLNPAVAGAIIAVVVLIVGFLMYKNAGKTMTKDEASGKSGIQMTAPAGDGK